MANVKKSNDSGADLGGWMTAIIIVGCVFVGWIIWKFIMGSGGNFVGGLNTGEPLPGKIGRASCRERVLMPV